MRFLVARQCVSTGLIPDQRITHIGYARLFDTGHNVADLTRSKTIYRPLFGSHDPNLKRWAGQFGKSVADGKQSKKTLGAIELTLFDIEGTYQPGRPMAPKPPKPGFAMIGAIAQTKSSGNYFLKLTGPKNTVEAAREAFMTLLDSLKEKSPG